jgi:hypothetical protein
MNYADCVQETTTATDTTTVALLGATTGNRTAAAAFAVGTTTIPFRVVDGAGNWQLATYTLTNGTTLTRETILSSNGTLGAGSKTVSCVMPADGMQRGLVNPDDVGFDIIIGGPSQSNFCSRGVYDSLADVINPRVFQFGGANTVYSGNTIDAAHYRTIFNGANPVHNEEGVNTGNNSMLAVMASAYIASQPSNRMALIVPVAHGGTTMVAANFNGFTSAPWAVGGVLHENMIAQAVAALAAAQVIYPNSRIVAFGSLIGESDQTLSTTQAAFVTAYKAVIADARTRLSAPNAVFVICGMAPEYFAPAQGRGHQIDDAHRQIAAETSKCIFVPGVSGYVQGDVTHYTGAGVRIMGAKAGLAVRAAQFATGVVAPASAVTVSVSAGSGVTGSPVTVTVGTNNPLTGAQSESVALSANVAGTFATSPLTLNASIPTASTTYTPSASGSATITATPTGTPSLSAATVGYTVSALTVPGAPTGVTASVGNAQATVSFSAPASNGGAAITGYTVTASTGQTATGSASPITVTGLTNGTATTFTVHATNSVGNSAESSASSSVTPAAATAPGAPTIGTATAGNASASVAFTAPGSTGGSAITGYTVTSTPGGFTGTGTASPISVAGLTNGSAYTFTVHATNAIGNSAESAASNSVTPSVPAQSLSLNNMGFMQATATANVYQGTTGGFWGSEGYGTLNLAFQNGVDGEFVVQMLDVPKHAADNTGREIGIGVDAVSTAGAAKDYTVIDYFLMHRADACKVYTNSTDAGSDSGGGAVVAAQNDYLRAKRTGSAGAANTATLTLDVSHNAGSSWTTIKTFAGAPTGALFAHVNAMWTTSVKLVSASGLA